MTLFWSWIPAILIVGVHPARNISAAAGHVNYIEGSTTKVCQLTGELDRSLGTLTLSQTGTRFGFPYTDLGSSFEHKGQLYFLFGDSIGRPGDRDALAWTRSRDPTKIRLEMNLAEDGKWLPLTVPGIRQGAFEVPSGGISLGGKMYVAFTTDHSAEKVMGRSVLAVSDDDGKTFRMLYDLSKDKFINVSFWRKGEWLYIYGSGEYRKSSVSLARIRAAEIEQPGHLEYLGALDGSGRPIWSAREEDAVPLFRHDVVGEFSVAYCAPVKQFVMLYNSEKPRGIVMRSAETPWGPWSDLTVIFDPWRDGGYGHFIHIASSFKSASDTVNDPGREAEWGGEYGPFLMSRYTTGNARQCRIYFTMSTWNPYQVVIMQSDLKAE